jgi:hypothetical protein
VTVRVTNYPGPLIAQHTQASTKHAKCIDVPDPETKPQPKRENSTPCNPGPQMVSSLMIYEDQALKKILLKPSYYISEKKNRFSIRFWKNDEK